MYVTLSVALGGAIGAVSRYWISSYVYQAVGGAFPWATLTVNILGCAILGVLIQLMALVWSPSESLRVFLTVGLLGALTTFSAFSLEMVLMIERGDWLHAIFYVLLSVVLCIGATIGTMALAKMILL
jgi:CrcB protein